MRFTYNILFVTCFLVSTLGNAQNTVTIGSEALNDKAVLTLMTPSGDQGFILPVVDNKAGINPGASENGMLVYESSTSAVFLWNGSEWVNISGSGSLPITQLNEIGDVSAISPTEGQILQFQAGVGWVANDISLTDTDDQGLLFAEGVLTIEDGDGAVDLAVYRQDINFNEETNALSITDGSTIILPFGAAGEDTDPTNELQDIGLSGTELSITDGSTIDLAPIIPSGGSDDQTAGEVFYDNTTSGLVATDVQMALDELASTPAGSLWSTKTGNVYYNNGNVGIGTADPIGKLHVDIEGETEGVALRLSNNYTGASTAYGSNISVNGESSGSKIGSRLVVEGGQGAKAGQTIVVDQQAEAIGYGQLIQLVSNNGDQPSAGISLTNGGTGTGDKYGILSGAGGENSKNTGIYSTIQGGTGIGLHTVISNNSGNSTGVLSQISGNTSPVSRGFHSIISEGGEKIGFESEIVQDNNILNSYGVRSSVVNNNSVVEQYGIHSTISGNGTGPKFGFWSQIYAGTGEKTGVYSSVIQPGDEMSYGFYSNMVGNGTEPTYGYYAKFDKNALGDGDKTGAYFEMQGRGVSRIWGSETNIESEGDSYAIGHEVLIRGTSTGDRTSFSSRLIDGNNAKVGYESQITQNFPRTTYGFESTITDNSNGGSVGLRLRVVDNVNAGVAYGILSTGDSLSVFDGSITVGHQLSGRIVKVGSWHFQNEMGTSPPDLFLYVGGTLKGGFSGINGGYYNVSDERLKTNIHQMNEVLANVMQLKPSRYQFKSNYSNSQENIGLIAQEVEPLFPELVNVIKDKRYADLHTLNYSGLSVIAIKAIQEQQALIESQHERIKKLEQLVEKLLDQLKQ